MILKLAGYGAPPGTQGSAPRVCRAPEWYTRFDLRVLHSIRSFMWIPWTSYFSLLLEAALLANLARNGLLRVYKWFFAYLSADLVETAIGTIFQENKQLFAQIYFTGQTVKTILAVLVVLELYRLA